MNIDIVGPIDYPEEDAAERAVQDAEFIYAKVRVVFRLGSHQIPSSHSPGTRKHTPGNSSYPSAQQGRQRNGQSSETDGRGEFGLRESKPWPMNFYFQAEDIALRELRGPITVFDFSELQELKSAKTNALEVETLVDQARLLDPNLPDLKMISIPTQ